MAYPHISGTKADNLSPLPFLKVDEAQLYRVFQEVEGLKARGRMMVIILFVGWIKTYGFQRYPTRYPLVTCYIIGIAMYSWTSWTIPH